jgi:hypothetical protein
MEANKKHRSLEEMTSLISSWETSGLSKQEFCKRQQIAYSVFLYWSKKIKEKNTDVPDSGFIEIKEPRPVSGFEIIFPTGCIIRFSDQTDPSYIRKLVF